MRKYNLFALLVVVFIITIHAQAKLPTHEDGAMSAIFLSDELEYQREKAMLNDIVYIEEEEEIDLGFNTYLYLPERFDPYKGMEIDLKDIEYIDCSKELSLEYWDDVQ